LDIVRPPRKPVFNTDDEHVLQQGQRKERSAAEILRDKLIEMAAKSRFVMRNGKPV